MAAALMTAATAMSLTAAAMTLSSTSMTTGPLIMKAAATAAAPLVGLIGRGIAERYRQRDFGYFAPYQALYTSEALHIHRIDKGDGGACALRTGSSAYTVYVVLTIWRHVIVYYE